MNIFSYERNIHIHFCCIGAFGRSYAYFDLDDKKGVGPGLTMEIIKVTVTSFADIFDLKVLCKDKDGFEVHFEKSGFKTIKKALQCAIDRDFAKQNDIT